MTARARILIVEDEQIVAEDLREVLERNQYTVLDSVPSGPEAIESAGRCTPDIILMDIHLIGDMNGIETAQRIHEHSDIPIIYLTSFSTEGDLENAKLTDPYGYITKPFDPQTIVTTIEIALSKHAIDIRTRANLETYRFIAEYTSSWEMWSDTGGNPIFVSPSCERITGYTPAELIANPALLAEMVHPDDRRTWQACMEEAAQFTDRDFSLAYRILTKNGDVRWIQHRSKPIRDGNGTLRGRRISNSDVTAEQEHIRSISFAIRESNERYYSLAETMKDTCVFVYDFENGIEYINAKGAGLFGKRPEELLNRTVPYLSLLPGVQNIITIIGQFVRTGTPAYFEETFSRFPDDEVALEIWLFTLRNERQEPRKIWAIMHDVSEKKRDEKKIRESLREKEILLKEIHHRVKNNLQQVASLLYLQETRGDNRDPVTALRESRNRIYSMALAHEILYGSKDLAHVDVDSYITRLAGYLRTSFGITSGNITIRTGIDPGLSLPLDDCITCGIIVNELVSNAMKYAFAPGSKGEIAIGFRCPGPHCVMSVCDNGHGLPPGFSLEKTGSFGLQLVANLVRQLEGTVEISRENGTSFTITFPRREPGT